ncbi:hypothetical protein ACWEV3_13170 [Saccharopolyspora sp. NPDC003752]
MINERTTDLDRLPGEFWLLFAAVGGSDLGTQISFVGGRPRGAVGLGGRLRGQLARRLLLAAALPAEPRVPARR